MEIREFKQRELDCWKEFGVDTNVPDEGQPALSHWWVCTEKVVQGGTYKAKARLVAHEYEEHLEGRDIRVDSPTEGKVTLKFFLLS